MEVESPVAGKLFSTRFTLFCLYLCIAVCLWSPSADSHPQCLNFQAPYRDSQISYCTEYKDYGCCWRVTDRRARKRVDYLSEILSRNANETVLDECKPYLRNISCLFCNPYVAHLFDIEESQARRPFPWLCADYCVEAYRYCHTVLLRMFKLKHKDFGLTQNPANLSVLEDDAVSFCTQVNPTASPYCYPQVLDGPQLPDIDPQESSGDLNCICGQPVASGLRNPLVATHSGDKSGRLFIVEQIGAIRVLTADNVLLPHPFLDITSRVLTSSSRGDERGLLGLAFHPNYATNGKFYVYYSARVNFQHWSRVSEFTVSSDDSNIANASSERELWTVQQPANNHNGGQLLFHEGYLLIFLGDGGGAGDQFDNALDRGTWLGSTLRIDVDRPDPSRGTVYSIPPDNPFVGQPDVRPEIFAYGLRNPWRCSVDRGERGTGAGRGRIFCGDVGQGRFEEVDIIFSGGNYGWRAYEGSQCFDSVLCNDESLGPFEPPIDVYPHSVGVSITGGYVYRGCLFPNLRGLYIFGDYGSGRLFALRQVEGENGGVSWQRSVLCMGDSSTCIGGLVGQERERFILSFGEDEDGELYMLTTSSARTTAALGVVYHIVDPARRESPTQCRTRRSF